MINAFKTFRFFVFAALLFAVAACGQGPTETGPPPTAETAAPTPTRVGVYVYSNPAAFDMQYPAGWSSNLVRQGILILAPPQVISLDVPGPSVTIFRVNPGLSDPNLALNLQLQEFLDRGPLNEEYQVTAAISPWDLGQYSGYITELERTENTELGLIAMRARIVVIRAENAALYYVMATSPTGVWEDNLPLFTAVFQSFHFNE